MTININTAESATRVDIGIPDLEAKMDALKVKVDAQTGLISALQKKSDAQTAILQALSAKFDQVITKENQIMADQKDLQAALDKVDAATTTAAANLQTIVTTGQTVSDEVKALQAALTAAGVPQSLVDQAGATAAKAQAFSDGLGQFVPFMAQLATDASNPVPVPVPVPVPAPAGPPA